ncbi:hypothetical protein BGZ52_008342, partial [Haplosporangium bisporale]
MHNTTLLKATCMVLAGYAYYGIVVPPKAGTNVSKTDDKLAKDSSVVQVHIFYAMKIAPTTTILFTALYLYLLWQGKIPSSLE